ncbi:hypothetical protein ACIQCJ_16935 [Streptomyces sp. NPDC093221]|uniref:hypothetical protein n=1 Tax=Streptomyces sp. NPDC093221 TaxID=3366032 RepID=UPI0038189CC5
MTIAPAPHPTILSTAASHTSTTATATNNSLTTILLLVLGSSVVVGALGHILTGLRAGAAARRDHYATAVRLLVARIEYPYRIRRRTNDSPETLAALASAGHDLQERLAQTRAWITAESRPLGELFDHCLSTINTPVATACCDAWAAPPITAAGQMNLGGFGPGSQSATIASMEHAISYRFGIHRLLPTAIISYRLRRRGYLP